MSIDAKKMYAYAFEAGCEDGSCIFWGLHHKKISKRALNIISEKAIVQAISTLLTGAGGIISDAELPHFSYETLFNQHSDILKKELEKFGFVFYPTQEFTRYYALTSIFVPKEYSTYYKKREKRIRDKIRALHPEICNKLTAAVEQESLEMLEWMKRQQEEEK